MTRKLGSVSKAAPRSLEVPEDFKTALGNNSDARAVFEKFSFSHKREWVDWITQAKKSETRERRIAKAIAVLLMGKQKSVKS